MRHVRIAYGAQSSQLKEIRHADRGGQGRHSFTAQQQTLRRLNTAFMAFHDRVNAGKKPGYPRFKSHQRFSQVLFVAERCTMAAAGLRQVGVRHFPGGRHGQSAPAPGDLGTIKALQLKRQHRRWYVIMIAETVPLPLPPAGRSVGVEYGRCPGSTTSDGEVIANPRFLAASAQVIAICNAVKRAPDPGQAIASG